MEATIDCAENFDTLFEFHRLLDEVNKVHGLGKIIAVVWSTTQVREGTYSGMVILEDNTVLTSRRFTVHYTRKDYTLKFLGKSRHVVSDYFE